MNRPNPGGTFAAHIRDWRDRSRRTDRLDRKIDAIVKKGRSDIRLSLARELKADSERELA
jgi:hypothetical protein